ncbi:hypothetical protein SAMN05216246_11245 [Actinomyces denticolens]|uniref:Uncharacterized protein n=1 Tax=Actinomyces denticolens TaxID=52767 RepID=A0ABY1IGI5_9ACTO|nr:hypothetical protein [Actinomyces denticolens]SHJ13969.1 hypothetical protein SAMN05216246_11245 [Actinomyces denticolens]
MHMWQVNPDSHDQLINVIHDALELSKDGRGAKIQISQDVPDIPDGTFVITANSAVDSAYGDTNHSPGVTLNVLDMVNPETINPQELAGALRVSLAWRTFVIITSEHDIDEGERWFIQHPTPAPDDESLGRD